MALLAVLLPGCAFLSPAITPGTLELRIEPAPGASLPTDPGAEVGRDVGTADPVGTGSASRDARIAPGGAGSAPRDGSADGTPPSSGSSAGASADGASGGASVDPSVEDAAAIRATILPPSRPLRLPELLDFADRLSPRLQAMRERVARAEGDRMIAIAGLLPEAGVGYRDIGGTQNFVLPTLATVVGNFAYGGDADRWRMAELAVQWVVWDFGRSPARYGQAANSLDVANLQFDRARQTLRLDVTAAYFALLRAAPMRRIADEAVRLVESALYDARNFLSQGTAVKEDVQRAEVQLARMRLEQVKARTEEGVARAALNRTVGFLVAAPTAVVDDDSEPGFTRSLASCLEEAAARRDELRVALRTIDSARLGLGAAQADFLPRVVVGGTGIHVERPGPEIEQNVFAGGLGLELALFKGGRRLG
ncbi:MAG: TolC family protein, partial [Alphaproteobacteria bacterium]